MLVLGNFSVSSTMFVLSVVFISLRQIRTALAKLALDVKPIQVSRKAKLNIR
jgi:hypothetical protein